MQRLSVAELTISTPNPAEGGAELHVTVGPGVAPSALAYALEHLRALCDRRLVDSLRVSLTHTGRPAKGKLRAEMTAVLNGHVLRARAVDPSARVAIDHVHDRIAEQAALTRAVTSAEARP
jgi:hypothetical protein